MMLVAIAWAPQITNFPTLWQYLQSAVSYLTPSIVAVFILGIFWSRTNAISSVVTIIAGLSVGVVGFIMNEVVGVFQIQFLYAAAILFAFACVLMVVISLLTPPPPRGEDRRSRLEPQRVAGRVPGARREALVLELSLLVPNPAGGYGRYRSNFLVEARAPPSDGWRFFGEEQRV